MGAWFRQVPRAFFLSTQIPPFVWIYRWLYHLAIQLVVRRLSQLPPVRSIYLVGGMLDAPVYGVSDIDFHILVDGDDPGARERVVQELHFLKVWFPMLDQVDSIGVYHLGQFTRWYQTSVEGQVVLGPHRPRRLLFGPDVMAAWSRTLPLEECTQLELSRLGVILHRTLASPQRPDLGYQMAKVLVGVWRVVLWQRTGQYLRRAEVLADLERAGVLAPAQLRWLRVPTRHGVPSEREVWAIFHQLAEVWEKALPPAADELQPLGEGEPEGVAPEELCWAEGGPSLPLRPTPWRQEDLWAPLSPRWCGVVQGSEVGPGVTPAGDDGPAIWLELRGILRNMRTGEVVATRLCPEVTGHLTLARRQRIQEMGSEHLRQLGESVGGGEVMELPADVLVRGLLRVIYTHLLLNQGTSSLTSQAVRWEGWLRQAGRPRFLPAELQRRALHLARDLTGVSPPGVNLDAPLPSLTLSVLVCTRNRADLLTHCLQGIRRQSRMPDQVVVVDNGSTDHTRQVVESFVPHLPLLYVYLATPGIPLARNAALKAATGDILCFTDDDALPADDWLARLEDAFLRDPTIGLVGGDAVPASRQGGSIGTFFNQFMGFS